MIKTPKNPYNYEVVTWLVLGNPYIFEQPFRWENITFFEEIKNKIESIRNERQILSAETRAGVGGTEVRVTFAKNVELYNKWENEIGWLYKC